MSEKYFVRNISPALQDLVRIKAKEYGCTQGAIVSDALCRYFGLPEQNSVEVAVLLEERVTVLEQKMAHVMLERQR